MTLHDEGIETVIRWLEQCDNLYEREYAQNAIRSLREFQILRSLEPCPYCGSVETREKLQQQNKELREHSKRLAEYTQHETRCGNEALHGDMGCGCGYIEVIAQHKDLMGIIDE